MVVAWVLWALTGAALMGTASSTCASSSALLAPLADQAFSSTSNKCTMEGMECISPPHCVKLNSVGPCYGWTPNVQQDTRTRSEYLQVDLGQDHTITQVQSQGAYGKLIGEHPLMGWVERFEIHFSHDGVGWIPYQTVAGTAHVFTGIADYGTVKTHVLDVPFNARYLRYVPLLPNSNTKVWPASRLEFQGCPDARPAAPSFSPSYPSATWNETDGTIELTVDLPAAATVHYLVVPKGNPAPSLYQVIMGQANSTAPIAEVNGQAGMISFSTPGTPATVSVTPACASSPHDVYFIARDASLNHGPVQNVSVQPAAPTEVCILGDGLQVTGFAHAGSPAFTRGISVSIRTAAPTLSWGMVVGASREQVEGAMPPLTNDTIKDPGFDLATALPGVSVCRWYDQPVEHDSGPFRVSDCGIMPGSRYTIVALLQAPANFEDHQWRFLNFTAGDYCPVGKGGPLCASEAVHAPYDASGAFDTALRIPAWGSVYVYWTRPPRVTVPTQTILKLHVTEPRVHPKPVQIFAKPYCNINSCHDASMVPNQLVWPSALSALWAIHNPAYFYETIHNPDNTTYFTAGFHSAQSRYTCGCTGYYPNNEKWIFNVINNSPDEMVTTFNLTTRLFCHPTGGSWSQGVPHSCSCVGFTYDTDPNSCNGNNPIGQCCTPCPAGFVGDGCRAKHHTLSTVQNPNTKGGTFGTLNGTLANRSPLYLTYTMPYHVETTTNNPRVIRWTFNEPSTPTPSYTVSVYRSCSTSCPNLDRLPTATRFDIRERPWEPTTGLADSPMHRGTLAWTQSTPTAPNQNVNCQCNTVTRPPFSGTLEMFTLMLAPPTGFWYNDPQRFSVAASYYDICNNHGQYCWGNTFGSTCTPGRCSCDAGWEGDLCATNDRSRTAMPCCLTPTGAVLHDAVLEPVKRTTITSSVSTGYVAVLLTSLPPMNHTWGPRWTIRVQSSPSLCPSGLRGKLHYTFGDQAVGTHMYHYCRTDGSQWPLHDTIDLDGRWSYDIQYNPWMRVTSGCGCNYQNCARAVYIKVELDHMSGCAFETSASVTPTCFNGGTFVGYGNDQQLGMRSCNCLAPWSGLQCLTPPPPTSYKALLLDRTDTITLGPYQAIIAQVALPPSNVTFQQVMNQVSGNCTGLKAVYHRSCKQNVPDFGYEPPCPEKPAMPWEIENLDNVWPHDPNWQKWNDPNFPRTFVGGTLGLDPENPQPGEPGFYKYWNRQGTDNCQCAQSRTAAHKVEKAWVRWSVTLFNEDKANTCQLSITPTIKGYDCGFDRCVINGQCVRLSPDLPALANAATNNSQGNIEEVTACQCAGNFGGYNCKNSRDITEIFNGEVVETSVVDGDVTRLSLAISTSNSKVRVRVTPFGYADHPNALDWKALHREMVNAHIFVARLNAPPPLIQSRVIATTFVASIDPDRRTQQAIQVEFKALGTDNLDGTRNADGFLISKQVAFGAAPTPRPIEINFIGKGEMIQDEWVRSPDYEYGASPDGNATVVNVNLPELEDNSMLYIDMFNFGYFPRQQTQLYSEYNHYVKVEAEIDDPLGTIVGLIAIGLLAASALVIVFCIRRRRREDPNAFSPKRRSSNSTAWKAKTQSVEMAAGSTGNAFNDDLEAPRSGGDSSSGSGCCGGRSRSHQARPRDDTPSSTEKFCVRPLIIILGIVLAILFSVITVLFNIGLLHSSLSNILPVVDLDVIEQQVEDAMDSIQLPFLFDFFRGLRKYFGWLDFVTSIGLDWNCGGSLSMMAPVVYALGSTVLTVLVGNDLILKWGLRYRGSAQSSWAARKLRDMLATALSLAALMALQSAIVTLSQVTASVWDIRRSCSEFDRQVVTVGRVLCIIVVLFFFYLAVRIFANVQGWNRKALVSDWLGGAFRLTMVTLGLWSRDTVEWFEVVEKAKKFDNDPNDDDNLQQDTMTLIARARGLIWMPLPFGVILTKFCEASNSPPLFIVDERNITGLELKDSRLKRGIRWVFSIAKFVLMMAVVFDASVGIVVVACIASIASTAMDVVLTMFNK